MIRTAADFTALAAAPGVNSPLLGIRFVVRETSDPTLRIGIAAGKRLVALLCATAFAVASRLLHATLRHR
ncbi:MAG: hypothetical protein RLZZ588_445 [Chloroflexota bacterium]